MSGTWSAGRLQVERPSPETWEIDVQASSGGWLVVAESWAPGWRAWVNGREVDVARVDHALRWISLPPGDSVVRMRYAPSALRTGALISLVALIAALLRTTWRAGHRSDQGPASARGTQRAGHEQSVDC